jgi:hypothetical protein
MSNKLVITIPYLACALWLWPNFACYGQAVRIRIVSAKDGQPLKNRPVSVSYLYDKTEKAPPNSDAILHLQTDVNGEAGFSLPEPAPGHLWAVVHLTSDNWRCGCFALVETQDVIHKGITVIKTTEKSGAPQPLQARPGEILFTPRPLTLFGRIIQPFVKQ